MSSFTTATLKSTALCACALWLAACAATPSAPPTVEEGQATAPIEREIEPAPAPVDEPAPQPTAATLALVSAAQTAMAEEQHDSAIAYLERAVRIDPRNAELWIELSAAHLADNNLAAATQHVRKAIALAAQDPALTRRAWLQMADIREAEGNASEARAIRRRYQAVPG